MLQRHNIIRYFERIPIVQNATPFVHMLEYN